MTRKEILDELSISVACLLDDDGFIVEDYVADIEHIQLLVTKLENLENKEDENI